MGIKDFWNFVESDPALSAAGQVGIDIVKTALRLNKYQGQIPALAPNRLALVVDGEDCLDRLYGGYYSDWSCGGEWNHMLEFLSVFFNSLQEANVHTAIFINGALQPERFDDWISEQLKIKQNAKNIIKHLNKRGTPPPKVWWIPPTGIRSVLRLSLKHLNVPIMCSMESHRQEVIGFLRENGYHGIVADDSEYCIFDPPRFYSAHSLKLTLKSTVETKEILMDEIAKELDLNPNRFSLMAALLGNHVLTTKDLAEFHRKLLPNPDEEKDRASKTNAIIRAVVDYVRSLQTVEDVIALGTQIFGSSTDPRVKKLKDVVDYYNNGTEDGYKKFIPSRRKKREGIRLATDNKEAEGSSRQAYTNVVAARKNLKARATAVVTEEVEAATEDALEQLDNLTIACDPAEDSKEAVSAVASGDVKASEEGKYPTKKANNVARIKLKPTIPQPHPEVWKTALDRHRQASMYPALCSLLSTGDLKLPALLEDESGGDLPSIHSVYKELRQKVYGIIFNYHHINFTRNKYDDEVNSIKKKVKAIKTTLKKLTENPKENVVLHNGSPKSELEVLEEKLIDTNKKLELIEKNAPELMDIKVREWLPYNNYSVPELVEPKTCQWSVPTVKRLWFGTKYDDKQRRLRAFLSCLNSDTPLMMNTSHVPQHLLLMCCVLRYIMTQKSVLRKPELDAFLVTACSTNKIDDETLSRMKLDLVTTRGVQLATLFMQGIEMALLANDACGAPVPSLMCCPWLFFDGKLFHSKLRRAVVAQNLLEMCNNDMEMVFKVEQMRKAILDGLVPEFSNATTSSPFNQNFAAKSSYNMNMMNTIMNQNQVNMMMNPRLGMGMSSSANSGGQLVVAGSVVGQWGGANGGNSFNNSGFGSFNGQGRSQAFGNGRNGGRWGK